MQPYRFVLFQGSSSACTRVGVGFNFLRAQLPSASGHLRAGNQLQGSAANLQAGTLLHQR